MNWLVIPSLKPGSAPLYDQMQAIAIESCRKHLAGEWQTEIIVGNDVFDMFEKQLQFHRKAWELGDNSIFWAADMIALQPIEIFGKYPQLMLWWDTPASYKAPRRYLNDGGAYFPATMKAELWEEMDRQFPLRRDVWDHMQMLLNDMFYLQRPIPETDPTMNFCEFLQMPIPKHEAKVWHCHATRDRAKALESMKYLAEHGV